MALFFVHKSRFLQQWRKKRGNTDLRIRCTGDCITQGSAMNKIEICCFKNGQWTEATAPEWFGRAIDTDEAWTDVFKKHNITHVDEFDFGDSIDVYRAETGTYCVVFGDASQVLLVVFIDAASDYIQFRAQVIAPSVQLMLSTIQLDEWERTRRLSRAS